jgi:DNA-binding transcriptional LysR family regulator
VTGNFSATDGSVLREAALAGLGLAVVPSFMVASAVAAGKLELLLEDRRQDELGIYAVMSSARGLPLRIRAVVDFLVRRFARPDWRLESGERRARPKKPRSA